MYWNPQQLHSSRASKHCVLPLGKGPPGYLLPLTADMLAESGCPYCTKSMIATNAAIAFLNFTVLSTI